MNTQEQCVYDLLVKTDLLVLFKWTKYGGRKTNWIPEALHFICIFLLCVKLLLTSLTFLCPFKDEDFGKTAIVSLFTLVGLISFIYLFNQIHFYLLLFLWLKWFRSYYFFKSKLIFLCNMILNIILIILWLNNGVRQFKVWCSFYFLELCMTNCIDYYLIEHCINMEKFTDSYVQAWFLLSYTKYRISKKKSL